METKRSDTRKKILDAAARLFAKKGYAGTSIRDITNATKLTQPVIYYYFGSKAGLYKALLEQALNECYYKMSSAASTPGTVRERLVNMISVLFEFVQHKKDLTHLAFSIAFAAEEEVPGEVRDLVKERRIINLYREIFSQAQKECCIRKDFTPEELAHGIHGVVILEVMGVLIVKKAIPDRVRAERIVDLFLTGAQL